MIDSFPFDEWQADVQEAFWTFGPQNSTGTYVLTVLGIVLMVIAIIGWVWLEHQKLTAQANRLKEAGGLAPTSSAPPTGETGV
jgi:hypothetical protein